jgi:hypothetical protein
MKLLAFVLLLLPLLARAESPIDTSSPTLLKYYDEREINLVRTPDMRINDHSPPCEQGCVLKSQKLAGNLGLNIVGTGDSFHPELNLGSRDAHISLRVNKHVQLIRFVYAF